MPPYTTPLAVPPPGAIPPPTLLSRTTRYIEEHRLLILGCAVLAASGAGYYLYSSRSVPGPSSAGTKGKKHRKKKSHLEGEGTSGPLLEEITPEEKPVTAPVVEKKEDGHLDDVPDEAALAAMTTDVRLETVIEGGQVC